MPYVSLPVRHVRGDPIEGERIDLLVRIAQDADVEAVEAALRELSDDHSGEYGEDVEGPAVEDRGLRARSLTVPQRAVDDVCELEGLASVETTDVLSMHLDGAGEDVEY